MAEKEITEASVLALVAKHIITASRGTELLGMSEWNFHDLMHDNGVTLWDDTPEEVEEDLRDLRAFFREAKEVGLIEAVKPLYDGLRAKGVLIREGIYQEALREAGELRNEGE